MKTLMICCIFYLLAGCQSAEQKSDEKQREKDTVAKKEAKKQPPSEDQKPQTRIALKADDESLLAYQDCEDCGFRFLKDAEYGAVTLHGKIMMKNVAGQVIRQVAFEMPLVIEYKSGFISRIELRPGTNGSYNYIGGLKGEWKKPEEVKKSGYSEYAYIEDWAPGELKTFEFYMGMPTNKVTGEKPFMRTPKSLKLKAQARMFRALDYEFTFKSLAPIDVKEFWIDKQEELGYRE